MKTKEKVTWEYMNNLTGVGYKMVASSPIPSFCLNCLETHPGDCAAYIKILKEELKTSKELCEFWESKYKEVEHKLSILWFLVPFFK